MAGATPQTNRHTPLIRSTIAFYDEPVRFAAKVNELYDELEQRITREEAVPSKDAVRIMVAGVPMALPNWKLHNLVENAGGGDRQRGELHWHPVLQRSDGGGCNGH
jgi:benzoyl-CoA reductase/2-hydroxyglutaryl-CoA dehydratase subunit BcrC/BadD/HgdB